MFSEPNSAVGPALLPSAGSFFTLDFAAAFSGFLTMRGALELTTNLALPSYGVLRSQKPQEI